MQIIFETKIKFWQLWKKYILNAFKHVREDYHVGWTYLKNVDGIETELIKAGWQPNYFSFADEGQITSMRRMYITKDGLWKQYHVRVHEDGEIRGHDELAYEEDAIAHEQGIGSSELPENTKNEVLHLLMVGI